MTAIPVMTAITATAATTGRSIRRTVGGGFLPVAWDGRHRSLPPSGTRRGASSRESSHDLCDGRLTWPDEKLPHGSRRTWQPKKWNPGGDGCGSGLVRVVGNASFGRSSPYPSTRDLSTRWPCSIAKEMLANPARTVFEIVDRDWLARAVTVNTPHTTQASRHGLERTLDIALWLDMYAPTVKTS